MGGGVRLVALKNRLPLEELIVTCFNDIGLIPARRC